MRNSVVRGAVGIQSYEGIVEVDYGAKITPWLTLRPNLQYVVRPGDTGTIPNALVLGLYTQVTSDLIREIRLADCHFSAPTNAASSFGRAAW